MKNIYSFTLINDYFGSDLTLGNLQITLFQILPFTYLLRFNSRLANYLHRLLHYCTYSNYFI